MTHQATFSREWPQDEFARLVPYEAVKIGQLVADETAWVERRVETIAFVDETTVRRHTSVHFDVPRFPPAPGRDPGVSLYWVPLALLRKDVLRRLDVRDEEGRALPVLSQRQNSQLSSEMLRGQAEVVLGVQDRSGIDPLLGYLLDAVVGRAAADAPPAGPTFADQVNLVMSDPSLSTRLRELLFSFLLLVRVDAGAHQTRVVKFAYDFDFDPSYAAPRDGEVESSRRLLQLLRSELRSLLTLVGLRDTRYEFATPAMFDAQSYHIEMVCPDEITITEAVLVRVATESPDGRVVARDTLSDRAHLYVTAPHPVGSSEGFVVANYVLRPALVMPVALLSGVVSAMLGFGLVAHFMWGGSQRSDTAAALIVAVPTFFAPFVAPGTHRMVRRMFVGLRALAFVAGLCSFAAASALVLNLPMRTAEVIWISLFGLAAVLALIAVSALGHSWWRTRQAAERSRRLIPMTVGVLALAVVLDLLGNHVQMPNNTQWAPHVVAYLSGACASTFGFLLLRNEWVRGSRPTEAYNG